MAIAEKETIEDRLEAAKQLLALDYTTGFIRDSQITATVLEVEVGNALYREVHKNLALKKPWLGVPGPIAYEDSIKGILTDKRVEDATKGVQEIIALTPQEVAERICESHHNQTWGKICFFEDLKKIEEPYQRNLEAALEEENYDQIKHLKSELEEKLFSEVNKKTFEQLNPVKEQEIHEEEKINSQQAKSAVVRVEKEVTKKESTYAKKFRKSVKQGSNRQSLGGFGAPDVADPRNNNILTKTHAAFNTPTNGELRPSGVQYGDVSGEIPSQAAQAPSHKKLKPNSKAPKLP